MAASFGGKLLREVHEEGLDELLHDLRALYHETVQRGLLPSHLLGIAPLDELLAAFTPVPMPVQFPNQPQAEQGIPLNPLDRSLHEPEGAELGPLEASTQPLVYSNRKDPVVEILSTSSAAGKTQILYYLAVLAVLPSRFNDIPLNGHNSAVIFIDIDDRFDAERLRTIALGIVQRALQTSSERWDLPEPDTTNTTSLDALITSSLKHIHVFRPQSSLSLLTTLQSLDAYLLDVSRHSSANRPLQAILIDSASAFLWQDKLRDEIARIEDIGRPVADIERERHQKQSFYLADLYADIVTTLKRLQRLFDCIVVYTVVSWGGRSTENSSHNNYNAYNPSDIALPNLPALRTPLPAPWGLFPTLRLVVQREPVRPFPPAMTMHESQQDAPLRQRVVRQGKFVGWVNGFGCQDWPRQVIDGVKRHGGRFIFCVQEDGVMF